MFIISNPLLSTLYMLLVLLSLLDESKTPNRGLIMTIEQRLDQLEKRNKRLTVSLMMMAVVICAVVTMAATGEKVGDFDTVRAKNIFVENAVMAQSVAVINDENKLAVSLGVAGDGNGTVTTYETNGSELFGEILVDLTASPNGGLVEIFNSAGEDVVQMYADDSGNGVVGAYNRNGIGRTLQPGP